ncbi:lysophospholipase [Aurantimonas sp. MSK8Z-1]|uniref:alpha/beta hydrolase n=1 Tax=Mangrovibrevibacter kandeliae TaxID=2968473 RepID=UPI0021180403|nr:alpha/beta fold hydrolase [Aurantimonas sp. MSK8Z-1]MCW4114910.1 lysophospholipase [Aurantimonas sp. MSK8Z-1]
MTIRIILAVVILLVLAGIGLWVFGPREPVDTTVTFDPSAIGSDPDAYLARTEADVPNLRPDAQKAIVWAYPASRAKTPLTIVYVHGFSASKEEVRPLPDEVAKALGANLYFTRLTGHGRNGPAMAEARVNDWINDFAEALAIAERIGERVVVVSTSTGGSIATLFAATHPELMGKVAGLVEISPNFALRDPKAWMLNLPFARRLMPWVLDAEYGFEPVNAGQADHWTTRYPSSALLTLGAVTKAAREADVGAIRTPAFFITSPADAVVDPDAAEAVLARWGGPHQALQIPVSGDPANHVLAGQYLSPQTTDELAQRITDWIKQLPAPVALAR